ncbi:MAG: hypothetical protein K2R98_15165 [Gemmataceae bacterium]|nr:hypothetical protein [Gemmataceae bacterium]
MRWSLIDLGSKALLSLAAVLWLAGCGHQDCESCPSASSLDGTKTQDKNQDKESEEEAEIRANRAKLGVEDQKRVAAQEYCPIMQDNRLGSMDVPIKVMVKDKEGKEHPVFVCCKGCVKKAHRAPEQTLATLEQLKAKVKAAATQPR